MFLLRTEDRERERERGRIACSVGNDALKAVKEEALCDDES